ncbi:MAG: RluA family pseudouridine synthase [Chloroflexota bacterium]
MPILVLTAQAAGDRLDRYLADQLPTLSRSQVQRLIAAGRVQVSGQPARASYRVLLGEAISVDIPESEPEASAPAAERLALNVLYEDEHLLVINKPAGLVVHPAPGHAAGTLVNALLAHRPALRAADLDPARPGIVHRLDRDTSGLLVVAATREAQAALQAAFKGRRVYKLYLALVLGALTHDEAVIEAPIGRDPRQRQRMAVLAEGGRPARTAYRVRERLPDCTLVEAQLITGRTHQIRVHLASVGHPVVGDRVYGPRRARITAPRQMLHAWRLELAHPVTGAPLAFEAPLPPDMAAVLERLRAS